MEKKKDIFNSAFENLESKMVKSQKSHKSEPAKPEKKVSIPNDENYFQDAMSDVTPLTGNHQKTVKIPNPDLRPAHPAHDDEQEVMSRLWGLVKGSIEMDITFSDEYVEGAIKGFSQKLMKKLKKGKFSIQGHLDLHGLTKLGAETMVREFIIRSHRVGHRCVLIVHGRGLNSPDSFPVLKEGLPRWLGRAPVKRIVLAFATARPYDGGTGAIYVLLKKR